MKSEPVPRARPNSLCLIFAAVFGAFLGLTLLKFGNPPIMEKYVNAPADGYEFLLGYPWPIAWGYGLLVLVAILGVFVARWDPRVWRGIGCLPLLWLGWQCLAATQSVNAQLTLVTLRHFAACVACFYLGFFSLGHFNRGPFWLGLAGALVLVLVLGFEQHFGGLDETRRYFFLYVYPKLADIPHDYIKKLSSNRIFGTLFYPNALAGALLLLMPPVVAAVLDTRRMTTSAKSFLAGAIALASLICLFWSGSKGGWLLMLLLGVVALLRLPVKRQLKLAVLVVLLLGGVTGFALKYAGFFQRGATSVVARFDYWRAAIQTTAERPLWGSGPGTFAIPYEKIKRPESEMSRLVHNDYLEQASDSGIPGFLVYTAFIALTLWLTRPGANTDRLNFAIWLGLLGWSLQSWFEFSLYIPALAWPAFTFMGFLASARGPSQLKSVDKPQATALLSARK
jgi:O-antigen ligase